MLAPRTVGSAGGHVPTGTALHRWCVHLPACRCEYVLPDGLTDTWGHVRTEEEVAAAAAAMQAARAGQGPPPVKQPLLQVNNERFMVPEALFHPSGGWVGGVGGRVGGRADGQAGKQAGRQAGLVAHAGSLQFASMRWNAGGSAFLVCLPPANHRFGGES